jgi:hypothetical protein
MALSGRPTTVMCRAIGNFTVTVHNALPPLPAEWAEFVEVHRTHPNPDQLRCLVYTEGGSPNAAQRSDLTAALPHKKMKVSVVTTSVLARAAGTAIAWLVPNLRMFSPADFEKALDHISASGIDRKLLRDAVDQMRRELSGRE